MEIFACPTCGKNWPEAYCPECARSIKPVGNAQPPPLPPPPIPVTVPKKKNSGSLGWRGGLALILAAAITLGYFGYHLYQMHHFPPGFRNRPSSGFGTRAGEHEFDLADEKINKFESAKAFGNTPVAVKLAAEFSDTLRTARSKLFTSGPIIDLLDTSHGEFLTYCELHQDECAFIVHVSALRKYEKNFTEKVDARKLLAYAAWASAQTVLKVNHLGKPQMELAVGLRGFSEYGPMMVGYYHPETVTEETGIIKYLDEGTETQFLWPFFNPVLQK